MTDHTALISSLEKATEGSAELDAQIFRALGAPLPEQFASLKVDLQWQPDGSATMPVCDMQVRYTPPAYTTSLDAIVALIERKLPGYFVELSGPRRYLHIPTPVPNYWRADLLGAGRDCIGWGSTAPLALSVALLHGLRALQHQGGGNG